MSEFISEFGKENFIIIIAVVVAIVLALIIIVMIEKFQAKLKTKRQNKNTSVFDLPFFLQVSVLFYLLPRK